MGQHGGGDLLQWEKGSQRPGDRQRGAKQRQVSRFQQSTLGQNNGGLRFPERVAEGEASGMVKAEADAAP